MKRKVIISETQMLNITVIAIKALAPFVTLWVFKIIFEHRIKLNVAYFLIAGFLAIFMQILSIPVVGVVEVIGYRS